MKQRALIVALAGLTMTASTAAMADVVVKLGFAGPLKAGMVEQSGVNLDKRGNIVANDDDYRTSRDKLIAAGDIRRGQSLVVWAIREGRQAAREAYCLPSE